MVHLDHMAPLVMMVFLDQLADQVIQGQLEAPQDQVGMLGHLDKMAHLAMTAHLERRGRRDKRENMVFQDTMATLAHLEPQALQQVGQFTFAGGELCVQMNREPC